MIEWMGVGKHGPHRQFGAFQQIGERKRFVGQFDGGPV